VCSLALAIFLLSSPVPKTNGEVYPKSVEDPAVIIVLKASPTFPSPFRIHYAIYFVPSPILTLPEVKYPGPPY